MRDILCLIATGIISVAVTVGLIFGLFMWAMNAQEKHDNNLWNGGECQCGGKWEYEQAVGHRSSTSYIYVCTKCGKRIEISEVR